MDFLNVSRQKHEEVKMFVKRMFFSVILSLVLLPMVLLSQVRLKEIARLQGLEYRQLVGYGLVIGLNGTGDSKRSEFTMQSVVNMLQRFGITVPRDKVKSRNIAAVMVTGEVPVFARKGDRVDITISSIGDAKSLEGGVLLLTPLSTEDGVVVAMAQGPLTVGGFSVETSGGGGVRQNHTLVGRIPQGASLQKDLGGDFQIGNTLTFSLKDKDLTTTYRVVEALNQHFQQPVARAVNPYTIEIEVPPTYSRDVYRFLAEVEQIEITPDEVARVVINERTGTIVIGGNVTIGPAAIAHGNLSVEIRSEPIVSQPAPFSQGQTTVVPNTSATVYQDQGQVVTIDNVVTVQEIAQALNTIGLMPRDIIAVLQALKTAGALRAELVIM
ncbi:MAG: flagellar basal body P-ring protein FlgI [Methanobacteriota archaeon]|nr:MAG: flagellar basal body P-ring protein FlgI [Euryarchaeota archaeon]